MEEQREVGSASRVRSVPLPSFRKCLEDLPDSIQVHAKDLYENYFLKDPRHPLLKGKVVTDRRRQIEVFRVEIGRRYRALAIIEASVVDGMPTTTYVWYWCGSHEDYNSVVG